MGAKLVYSIDFLTHPMFFLKLKLLVTYSLIVRLINGVQGVKLFRTPSPARPGYLHNMNSKTYKQ